MTQFFSTGVRRSSIVIAAVVSWAIVTPSQGATKNWAAASGNWSVPGNWTASGVPGAGDLVNIVFADGTARTVTYDYTGAAITLNSLTIDLTGAGTNASTLSMAANTLTTSGNQTIGNNGRGTITQSGGTNTLTGTGNIVLGNGVGSSGTYNLSGTGILNDSGSENIGQAGAGTFNQSGGTNTANGGLAMAFASTGNGSYLLSGGTVTSSGGIGEVVGYFGTGTITQSGGSNTVNGNSLNIGFTSAALGTYSLNSGSLTVNFTEYVGYDATGNVSQAGGTFTQSGGTHNINSGNSLYIGLNSGSTGAYTLSGNGALSVSASEYVGQGGTGTFTQTGGSNVISQALVIAGFSGSTGNYTLSGGTLTAAGEIIGSSGAATFIQTGGTNTVGSTFEFTIGNNGFSPNSIYTLSGTGALVSNGNEYVGYFGTGTFNQSGGTNTINAGKNLCLGNTAGATGTYTLSSGLASVGGSLYVGGGLSGAGGKGVLNVSNSGMMTVAGTLVAYNTPNTAINLSGGMINAAALNFNGAPSLFNWTAGTLNITSGVVWDSGAAITSTSNAFGPSLTLGNNRTLMVTGNETLGGAGAFSLTLNNGSTHYVTGGITLNPTGVLNINSGSSLYAASFTQAGGIVNGTLINQGSFIYQSGQFNGRLVSQGTVSFGTSFSPTLGIENDAYMSLAAGQTVVAAIGFDNYGSLTLSGGVIFGAAGTGAFTNQGGGTTTVSAPSTISAGAFNNIGQMTLNSALTLSGTGIAPANSGVITVNSGGAIRQGYTNGLGNNGTLNFNGGSSTMPIFNNGIIQGGGTISGNLSNNAGGSVVVPAGSLLNVSNSWTNSGLVTLQGSAAALSGGAITNVGTIQGAGTIGASILNSTGTIRAAAGELDLTGSGGTNAAAAWIQAAAGNTVMYVQGLAANAGTIGLTGGAFDNNNQPLSNVSSGIVNGYGTLRSGGLTNTGKLNVGEGNLDIFGSVVNNGTIGIQGGRFAYFFGNVSGSGSYTGLGTATFLAALSPGNSPAAVNFGGNVNLSSSSTLNIEIGGTTSGSQYDQLRVAGQFELGGTLNVALINGFMPQLGQQFSILEGHALSGLFSTLQLPTLSGGPIGWDVSQLYSTGVLSIVPTYLRGDWNRDGQITAADIPAMLHALTDLNAYAFTNALDVVQLSSIGDFDNSGAITNRDIQGLLNLLAGEGGGAVAAVPEPSSAALTMLGAIGLCFVLRRTRRKRSMNLRDDRHQLDQKTSEPVAH